MYHIPYKKSKIFEDVEKILIKKCKENQIEKTQQGFDLKKLHWGFFKQKRP